VAKTDNQVRFGFFGFDCPDTTVFVLQGRTKRDNRNFIGVEIDKAEHQAALSAIPLTKNHVAAPSAYVEQAVQVRKYEESAWTINLPEVEIQGARMENEKKEMVWRNMDGLKVGRSKTATIKINDHNRLENELDRLPQKLYPTSLQSSQRILVYVDDVETGLGDLSQIPAFYFESIEMITGPALAMYGARGAGGVIRIKTRSPKDLMQILQSTSSPGIITYTPEGYCVRKEFYIPPYDKPAVKQNPTPDLRTAIYWNPLVRTNEDGRAEISFFTADNAKSYSYVLEGIGNNIIGYSIVTRKPKSE
jgi:hypothetical protein